MDRGPNNENIFIDQKQDRPSSIVASTDTKSFVFAPLTAAANAPSPSSFSFGSLESAATEKLTAAPNGPSPSSFSFGSPESAAKDRYCPTRLQKMVLRSLVRARNDKARQSLLHWGFRVLSSAPSPQVVAARKIQEYFLSKQLARKSRKSFVALKHATTTLSNLWRHHLARRSSAAAIVAKHWIHHMQRRSVQNEIHERDEKNFCSRVEDLILKVFAEDIPDKLADSDEFGNKLPSDHFNATRAPSPLSSPKSNKIAFSFGAPIPVDPTKFSFATKPASLPKGWAKVPSRSRPGKTSYKNVITGEIFKDFPKAEAKGNPSHPPLQQRQSHGQSSSIAAAARAPRSYHHPSAQTQTATHSSNNMAVSVSILPSPARAAIVRPPSNWFEQFLQKTGTEKYGHVFITEECTDATTLKLFSDNDFEQLGLKKGARLRVLEYLKNATQQPRTSFN